LELIVVTIDQNVFCGVIFRTQSRGICLVAHYHITIGHNTQLRLLKSINVNFFLLKEPGAHNPERATTLYSCRGVSKTNLYLD